jgi:hypothetical protein
MDVSGQLHAPAASTRGTHTRLGGLQSRSGHSGDEEKKFPAFLFATASRLVLRPTRPPSQRVPGTLSPGVKRPGHEADHSLPFSAKVKNAWSYTSVLPIRLYGVVLS